MQQHSATEFDVIIIGTGSGNSLLTPEWDNLRVAIVEKDIFGGTCLNRGCIPTKMLVYTADVVSHIQTASKFGIDATVNQVRWPDIVNRVFGRIDSIPPSGKAYRRLGAHALHGRGRGHLRGAQGDRSQRRAHHG